MKLPRLILATALLLTGCGAEVAGQPPAAFAPDDLMLQVRTSGGMIPAETAATALPEFSMYGDGRVITAGPVREIYPGPALPNAQVRHISPDRLRDLLEDALEAGVGNGADLGVPQVMDAGSTRITVRTAAGLVASDAPALGIEDDSLTQSQQRARGRLADFVQSLRDLNLDEPASYRPATMAAVAHPWEERPDGLPAAPPPVAWPGRAPLPGEPMRTLSGVHCLVTDAGPVLAAAANANARTPWTSGDARWEVGFRPLLPDEETCGDLVLR
ncbi:hypothetical protein ACQP00_05300 [Dactylosporangium sp. CS-047395]|uniref:hypothetical protein n=1 Tax=Dactylosporangium sp. CS-047395 TaxID=3239936 RepID=UPI003D92BB21